jgi:2,3-dihydroxybiphenyl 1,2-dioxygenase
MIHALSYVVVHTPRMAQWLAMAGPHIGLQAEIIEPGRSARLRADEKIQRLLLLDRPEWAMYMGFEVQDAADLSRTAKNLEAAGYPVTWGDAQAKHLRGVENFFHFTDPDGYLIEVACGLGNAATSFKPGRPLGGFRMGELGLGHVALITGHFEEMCRIFKEVLGFKVSDRAHAPFRVEFLHVNPRHHTLGIADTGGPAKVYHLMLEYNDFDDLGRAHDQALEHPESIGVTFGRHINDHMTSFYLKTPDGWMIELGWGGRTVGPDWEVEELKGMSLWGHDRTWLPDDKREQARQILRHLSDIGMRAPVVSAHQAASRTNAT